MSRYVTEAIGTFFLVLTIGLTVLSGSAFAPLAIGSALMVMVYMGGPVSGAHYNPAVTVAVYLRGRLPASDVLPYIASQLIGAILASLAVFIVAGDTFAPAPGVGVSTVAALLAEVLFTFALALVILNVAFADASAGNSYFGLAIGFTVMVGAFAVGDVSGGAFNPAVGTGPIIVNALVGAGGWSDLWLYWVGPLLGGVAAVTVFRLQHQGAGA